jgi:hypothetical protein
MILKIFFSQNFAKKCVFFLKIVLGSLGKYWITTLFLRKKLFFEHYLEKIAERGYHNIDPSFPFGFLSRLTDLQKPLFLLSSKVSLII